MSLKYQLTKKFRRNDIIACCCVSYDHYKRGLRDTLDLRVNGVWLYNVKPCIKDYMNYSHTFSDAILDIYLNNKVVNHAKRIQTTD